MENIVLSGGTGLLGQSVISLLPGRKHVIVRAPSPEKSVADAEFHIGDLAKKVPSTLPPRCDAVLHLAQSRRFREFPDGAEDMLAINVRTAVELASYAVKAKATHFIYASSGAVYGPSAHQLREDQQPVDRGLNFYAQTKRAAELLLAPFSEFMNVVVLRYFFIYGPRQQPDMLIPRLINNVRDGREIILHGPDGIKLNPIFVDDAANAIKSALRLSKSNIVNVAGPEICSLRQIVNYVGHEVGRQPLFKMVTAESPLDVVADIGKMKSTLGEPSIPVQTGLQRIIRAGSSSHTELK